MLEPGHAYVQIDGEFAGHLPAEVRIVPDALTLLVPPEYGGSAGVTIESHTGFWWPAGPWGTVEKRPLTRRSAFSAASARSGLDSVPRAFSATSAPPR